MFICTLKASNIKFFAAIFSAVALLITFVVITQNEIEKTQAVSENVEVEVAASTEEKINFDKIRTNDDRVAFLKQFGWEVDESAIEEITLKLPAEFDKIMTEYNEIQKSQGLDLSKYKGQEVVRYSYIVHNYPDYNGEVHANIIVCKNRVVGGDICSADMEGFIGTLYMPESHEAQNSEDTENIETN